jgi:hypothetical protein
MNTVLRVLQAFRFVIQAKVGAPGLFLSDPIAGPRLVYAWREKKLLSLHDLVRQLIDRIAGAREMCGQ